MIKNQKVDQYFNHYNCLSIMFVFMQPSLMCCCLKELEHRKLGWKVLILNYDWGKSLSKEMWCKMADTKRIWLHFLKDEKSL